MNRKIMTLCCVYDDKCILLGMKKRGFGAGRWNGFGGKVNEGETIEQAALRELDEEAGIKPINIKKRGMLVFKFENNGLEGNPDIEVNIFSISEFKGEPKESEEMRPQWFLHNEIPYANMWPDDIYWLPMLFSGKNFQGTFYFKDTNEIVSYELKEII
jgi:8-oxo-dGTP diphosphatase/2-hydroxy-dATP diphosphatase